MKTITLAFLCQFVSIFSFAQNSRNEVGIVVGPNVGFHRVFAKKPGYYDTDFYKVHELPGVSVGLYYRNALSRYFSFETNVLLSLNRSLTEINGAMYSTPTIEGYDYKRRETTSSLQQALIFQVHTPGKVAAFMNLGGTFIASGPHARKMTSPTSDYGYNYRGGSFGEMLDLGLILGLGARTKWKEKYMLSAEFRTTTNELLDMDATRIGGYYSLLLGMGYCF